MRRWSALKHSLVTASRTMKSWNLSTWPEVLLVVRHTRSCGNALEHDVRGKISAVYFEHVLLEHKVLAPECKEIGLRIDYACSKRDMRYLNGATGRAVVVETLDTTIDAEGCGVEEAMLQEFL